MSEKLEDNLEDKECVDKLWKEMNNPVYISNIIETMSQEDKKAIQNIFKLMAEKGRSKMSEKLEVEKESNLVRHARKELESAGWFDEDSDYDGEVGPAVLNMVKQFTKNGHSGYSANLCLDLFRRVASYKLLSPINNPMDENEFIDHTDISNRLCYQSTRLNSLFSMDGGKRWYDIDIRVPFWRRFFLRQRVVYVKFPYLPNK